MADKPVEGFIPCLNEAFKAMVAVEAWLFRASEDPRIASSHTIIRGANQHVHHANTCLAEARAALNTAKQLFVSVHAPGREQAETANESRER